MDLFSSGTTQYAVFFVTAAKTDLNLLLECLKYQMNCPDSQKQALLAIYSICQEKGEIIDYFREVGGVLFVYNLSKSSKHMEVKKAALFTLGGLAECNVFCQQVLCSVDFFTYMVHVLAEDSPLTLKRVAVYMVSVLVSNNKSGQVHAKTTGCIDILLHLFRTSFPVSDDDVGPANISELWQLWTSVSSALCGCVNNPQNEENQWLCMSIFPVATTWLEKFVLPRTEIVQPICSLIGMTVANNPSAQERFSSTGGLRTLTQSLVRLASESARSPLARDLAVLMTKTLCVCITDNDPLASGLAQYHLVPRLLTLLSCPTLDPGDRLCIVLALGHCTESCEEHQVQLLQAGGLSHMIQLLAESQDDELKKAATFVLQTCKQMSEQTKALGVGGAGGPLQVDPGDPVQQGGPPCDVQSYWRSAWEMQRRIMQLENPQAEQDTFRGRSRAPSGAAAERLQGPQQGKFRSRRVQGPQQGTFRGRSRTPSGAAEFRGRSRAPSGAAAGHLQGPQQGEFRGRSRASLGDAAGCLQGPQQGAFRGHSRVSLGDAAGRVQGPQQGEFRGRSGPSQGGVTEGERDRANSTDEPPGPERSGATGGSGEEMPPPPAQIWEGTPVRRVRGPGQKRGTARDVHKGSIERAELTPARPAPRSHRRDERGEGVGCRVGASAGSVRRQIFPAGIRREVPQPPARASGEGKRGMAGAVQELHHGRRSASSQPQGGASQLGEPAAQGGTVCSLCCGTSVSSSQPAAGGTREPDGTRRPPTAPPESRVIFQRPDPVERRSESRNRPASKDHMSLCSEILQNEISRILKTPATVNKQTSFRCSGCTAGPSLANSRNFTQILRSCQHKCDRHTVLLEAEDRFKRGAGRPMGARRGGWERCRHKNTYHSEEATAKQGQEEESEEDRRSPGALEKREQGRRQRKNFTPEEVRYLLEGVRKLGPCWNSILWSYPFQAGRTNVDLAKKYSRLQARKGGKTASEEGGKIPT
ncbi:telomere repeats-binding bouquet formation protein 1 [Megalops cyprinoides]|uniref:telomere repeats-binding bouquet formation protein 1 n=1 Tax=Megalops cyprinoides TaxID=118141 RepID=UPI001863AA10|nr:telomere repeats-binding bouquet formation protein 1 [Megalops cyprinoides]